MSARPFGVIASLSGGTQDVLSLLRVVYPLTSKTVVSVIVFRADTTNAGRVYFGGVDVDGSTKGWGFVDAGESLSIELTTSIAVDSIFLKGTALDKVHIWAIEY